MARSSGKKSGKKGGSGQKKSSVKFRTGVPAELDDHLLKQFIQTVRTGLELMLSDPSEHTGQVLKQNPWCRPSPIHQTLFNCRSAVERTNSRAKLTFREASNTTSIAAGRRCTAAACCRPLPC